MATIILSLKHVWTDYTNWGSRETKESVTDHGVAIEANEDGIAALTPDECRRIARMLNAMAGETDIPIVAPTLPGAM